MFSTFILVIFSSVLYAFAFTPNILEEFDDSSVISHAFVQTDSELQYFRGSPDVDIPNTPSRGKVEENVRLQFDPGQLFLTNCIVGIPLRSYVKVFNSELQSVSINALSSSSAEFHLSFPVPGTLEGGRATLLQLIFLPRSEGVRQSVIKIHTSIGVLEYKVTAVVKANPYRIRPSIFARLPLNGTFEFPISIHNPHSVKIQVADVHSSDSSISVIRDSSHPTELKPFETNNIGNIVVVGDAERNSTSFIMLKLNLIPYAEEFEGSVETIVIAVDVEVDAKPGLFSTTDLLDFGFVKYGSRSKKLFLNTYSTVERGLEVDSVYVQRFNYHLSSVFMQFTSKPPISVKKAQHTSITSVELVSEYLLLNMSEAIHRIVGEIVAESRGGNYNVTVPFRATVFIGGTAHNLNDVAFHSSIPTNTQRNIVLTNRYPFGLGIYNITMNQSAHKYFKISLTRPFVEIGSLKSAPVALIEYYKTAPSNFTAHCRLTSNITVISVQLIFFHGNIKVESYPIASESLSLRAEALSAGNNRQLYFSVTNTNPVGIDLIELKAPYFANLSAFETVEGEEVPTSVKRISSHNSDQYRSQLTLPPRSLTVFELSLALPLFQRSSPSAFKVCLKTNFEHLAIPLSVEKAESSIRFLEPNIVFESSYPGKESTADIRLYNPLGYDVAVHRIMMLTDDNRFSFKIPTNREAILKAGEISNIGSVTFSPKAACTDCYVGFPLHSSDGQWFSYGLKLPQNLAEIDSYLYARLRNRWILSEEKIVSTKILLETNQTNGLTANVTAKLVWPQLMDRNVVHFPLTAVGNFTIVNFTIKNPSKLPIIVQLLPLVIYPDAEAILDFFQSEFETPLLAPVEMNETLTFSLRDTELFTLRSGSPVPKMREQLENLIGGPVPRFTLSFILQPGMETRVRLGFLPTDYNLRSSLLLIRNNLTAIEPVVLYGRGARIDMNVDGKAPRSDALLFDILISHLADCHNPRRLTHKLPTTLTVKRTFVVHNVGEVGFTVTNLSISGASCEGRGFRILNCRPFFLVPNGSYPLDIAYTPDFLTSVNEASLQLFMHMNSTPWLFELVATVAPEMLSVCHTALPRPPFEWVMYYSCLFALVFCMICVSACAYLEADRFLTFMIHQQLEGKNTVTTSKTMLKAKGGEWDISSLFYRTHRIGNCTLVDQNFRLRHFVSNVLDYIICVCAPLWLAIRGDAMPKTNEMIKPKQLNDYPSNPSKNNARKDGVGISVIAPTIKIDHSSVSTGPPSSLGYSREEHIYNYELDEILLQNEPSPSKESDLENFVWEEEEKREEEREQSDSEQSECEQPEWMDATVEGNIDEIFETMVNESTELYRVGSALSASDHSQIRNTPSHEASADDDHKKKKKRPRRKKPTNADQWLTPKEINKLTLEYKRRLEAIAADPKLISEMGWWPFPLLSNCSAEDMGNFGAFDSVDPSMGTNNINIEFPRPTMAVEFPNRNMETNRDITESRDMAGPSTANNAAGEFHVSSEFFQSIAAISNDADGMDSFDSLFSEKDSIWGPIIGGNPSSLWPKSFE